MLLSSSHFSLLFFSFLLLVAGPAEEHERCGCLMSGGARSDRRGGSVRCRQRDAAWDLRRRTPARRTWALACGFKAGSEMVVVCHGCPDFGLLGIGDSDDGEPCLRGAESNCVLWVFAMVDFL